MKPQQSLEQRIGDGPPCDVEAEQAVLASLLLKPAWFGATAKRLTPAHFHDEFAQRIWLAMWRLDHDGKPCGDLTLLLGALKDSPGCEPTATWGAELWHLFRWQPHHLNLKWYVARVQEVFKRRRDWYRNVEALAKARHPRRCPTK